MSNLSVFDAAAEQGEREALVTDERTVSFRELADGVARAAAFLHEQGIEPCSGAPLALVMHPELATVELLLGSFALSRPVLLLHPRQGEASHEALIARTNAIRLDTALWRARAPRQLQAWSESNAPDPEAVRVIVPTSGTTGRPKLVMLSERALLASAGANWRNFGVTAHERWLLCLPLAHVGGLSILTRCLYARRAAVLFPADGSLLGRAELLARSIRAQRVTLVSLVPTLLEPLLDAGLADASTLRGVLLGGAAPNPTLLARGHALGLPLLTSYGLTEASSQLTTRPYAERYEPVPLCDGLPSSGQPLHGVSLRIAEGSLIEVRAPMLLSGYFDDPGPALSEDGYLRTGDRGELGAHGLVVKGRSDDLIVSGGENVDPLAVEAVLAAQPEVQSACVFGIEDPRWGELVCAALVFRGAAPDEAALRRLCSAGLAAHERPRLVAILRDLPRTASGKLDRAAVKRLAREALVPLRR